VELGLRGNNKLLFEDREGNVWRGSFGGGLTRLRPKIFSSYELPETEFDRYANGICTDNAGNTWMLINQTTPAYVPAGGGPETLQFWQQTQGFRTIYGDRSGTIWLGCGDGRIGRWRDGKFAADLKVSAESDLVNAFFQDSKSNLWVGFTQRSGKRSRDSRIATFARSPKRLMARCGLELITEGRFVCARDAGHALQHAMVCPPIMCAVCTRIPTGRYGSEPFTASRDGATTLSFRSHPQTDCGTIRFQPCSRTATEICG
jgi:hypothetical protein